MTALIVRPSQLTQTKSPKKQLDSIELRPAQKIFKKEIYGQIKAGHRRILAVAPCGFGKTIISASLVYDMTVRRDYKVLFLVHAKCLVEQTIEAFARYGIWAGAIAGGMEETRSKSVQVGMIQTLRGRRDTSWFKPDFVIADECHETLWDRWSLSQFPKLKDGQEIYTVHALDSELRVLGVEVDRLALEGGSYPTFEEVKSIHREMSKKNHPDQGGDAAIQKQINAAWDTIKTHRDLFESNRPDKTPLLIGLTATPWRLSKRQSMGDLFPVQVLGPTPAEQIEAGNLVPFAYWRIPGASTKQIRITAGDFNEADLGEAFSVPEVVQCAVNNYLSKASDRRFACFPTTVRHGQLLLHAFSQAGVKAALITGETPNKRRQQIYQEVKDNTLAGIISVGCIGIGFDLPEISCVIDCCPTLSINRYVQAAGRGQRLAPWIGKEDCVYLDQAGNVERHGMIESISYGELFDSDDSPKGVAPTKECPECGHILLATQMECVVCGYEFPPPNKPEAVGEMVLMVRQDEVELFHAFRKNLQKAYQLDKKPLWAAWETAKKLSEHPVVKSKGGKGWYPKKEWYYRAIFENPTHEDTQAYMLYLLRATKDDLEPKKNWWYEGFMKKEFGDNWKSLPVTGLPSSEPPRPKALVADYVL